MPGNFFDALAEQTDALRDQGLYKQERLIAGPQQAAINVLNNGTTTKVINLCANNYLGLANHPVVIKAAHAALDVLRRSRRAACPRRRRCPRRGSDARRGGA